MNDSRNPAIADRDAFYARIAPSHVAPLWERLKSLVPKAPSDTVVEVNAGVAPKNGVVAGAKLRYVEIPGR